MSSWPGEKSFFEDDGLQVVYHDAPQVRVVSGLQVATGQGIQIREPRTFYDEQYGEESLVEGAVADGYSYKETTPINDVFSPTGTAAPMYTKYSPTGPTDTMEAEPEPKSRADRKICGLKARAFWIILAVALFTVVAAAGIGAGLGMALRKSSPSSVAANAVSQNSGSTSTATSYLDSNSRASISTASSSAPSIIAGPLSTVLLSGSSTASTASVVVAESALASSSTPTTQITQEKSSPTTITADSDPPTTASSSPAVATITVQPTTTDRTSIAAAISTTTSASGGIASNLASIGIYTYYGCVTDNFINNVRALASLQKFSDSMTLEMCQSFCQGYKYFGTEYSEQCFCGTTFSGGATKEDDSNCDLLCDGNKEEICGGNDFLSVYVGS